MERQMKCPRNTETSNCIWRSPSMLLGWMADYTHVTKEACVYTPLSVYVKSVCLLYARSRSNISTQLQYIRMVSNVRTRDIHIEQTDESIGASNGCQVNTTAIESGRVYTLGITMVQYSSLYEHLWRREKDRFLRLPLVVTGYPTEGNIWIPSPLYPLFSRSCIKWYSFVRSATVTLQLYTKNWREFEIDYTTTNQYQLV